MASVSDRPVDPLAVRPWGKQATEGSKSDQYLARRFAAASADFKGMALVTFALAFGVAAVAWLVLGVVAEHWVVPGGLPAWGRWVWLGLAILGTAIAVARWLVPLIVCRVNLVYAARAIERDHPELHNDLVNAVLVKERSEEAAEAVVKSLRRRAAKRLSKLPDEGVVDRTPAVRLAWVLAALVGFVCLYQLLAPKSLVRSAARLVAPWSGIASPSRVRIEPPTLAWRMPGEDPAAAGDAGRRIDVVGGVAEVIRGRQLVLVTDIDGLADAEKPELVVTPLREDGLPDAAAAWRMPLAVAAGGRRTAILPGEGRGLDQPVELVIAAGDARSERIRVLLTDAPSVLVREVRYEYPAYMNREPETVPGQGDIRGVEGTKVTIVAASNRPLAAAAVDLGCDGRRDVSLALERPAALVGSGTFTLRLNAQRNGAEFASYRFMYRPRGSSPGRDEAEVEGQLEHRIEVIPDLAPEVAIEVPTEKVLRVPPDAPVTVRVRAVDPDFGLASVRVETRLGGGKVRGGEELLVGGPRASATVAETLVPSSLGAAPGVTLEYRAVAEDTRPDSPNRVATDWQALQIDASAPPQPPPAEEQQPEADGEPRDQGEPPGDGREGQPGEGGQSDPSAGDAGGNEPSDGSMKDAGDAGDGGGAADSDKPRQDRGAEGEQEGQQASGDTGQGAEEQGRKQGETGQRETQQGKDGQGSPPQKGEQQQGQQQDPSKAGEQQGEQRGEGQEPADQRGQQQGQQGRSEGKPGQAGREQGGQQGDRSGQGTDGERQDGQGRGQREGGQQGGQQPGEQRAGDRERGQPEGRASGDQRQGGQQPAGNDGGSGQQAGQRPDPSVAADGTDDGEAMERILENRRRNGADQQPPPRAGEQPQAGGDRGPGDEQNAGDRDGQKAEREQGGQSPDKGQQPKGENADRREQAGGSPDRDQQQQAPRPEGEQQSNNQSQCQGADGKPCGKSGCSTCSGGNQSGSGGGSNGQGQQGQGQQGQGQPGQGEGREGQAQQGQGQQGQGQQGQGQQGQGQQGQGQQGQGEGREGQAQQGQGQQGQGEGREGQAQQGQGQQGQGQQGQGQQGQGQQGQGQQGQGQQGQGDQAGEAGQQPVQDGAADGRVGQGGAAGSPEGGGVGNEKPAGPRELEWGQQSLDHARNAADLAIEHLRTSLDAGRTELLDELGWTPEQARAFLDRWRAMQRLAGSDDPRERAEFEKAVRSLGLRSGGVRSSRDVPADVKGGQAEGRRSRPPSDYREQFKAFMRGTSGP